MTHSTTNRNVARASHVKRVTIPLEDGWSMVTHSSPRGRSNMLISHGALCGTTEQTDDLTRANITEETSKQAKQEHERLYPRYIVNGLTVEKLLEEYHKLKKGWDETLCAKQLEAVLGSRKWNVKEAFCLATSSFSFDWENRTRALWQLVLFMDVVQKGKICILLILCTRAMANTESHFPQSPGMVKLFRYLRKNLCLTTLIRASCMH